jgi:integrase/recombinase XerD
MTESNMYLRSETWFLRAEIGGKKYRESLHTANVRDAHRLRDARLKVIEAQARHGAVEWPNPALDATRTLRERRDPIVLPDEGSIQAVFTKCSPHLRSLAVAARLTGARQAELTALKWSQFNQEAGTLEILKGKGNRRRVVKLSPAARQHIESLDRSGELIFPSADGPWTSVAPAFAKTVHRAAPRVPFRFHDLRHCFAVESLRGGESIYRVSKHLSHTSVKTTEIYLAHLTPDEADRACD